TGLRKPPLTSRFTLPRLPPSTPAAPGAGRDAPPRSRRRDPRRVPCGRGRRRPARPCHRRWPAPVAVAVVTALQPVTIDRETAFWSSRAGDVEHRFSGVCAGEAAPEWKPA